MNEKIKILSLEERAKLLKEALKRGDKPIEVNCFGNRKYKLYPNKKITLTTHAPARPEDFREYKLILLWNEKLKTWESWGYVEYLDVCPVCGRLMLVRALPGTTWIACCGEDCYKKWFEWYKKAFGGVIEK